MSKKDHQKLNEDEKTLFREANKGTIPHQHTKISSQSPPKKRIKRSSEEKNIDPSFHFYEQDNLEEVGSEDLIEFHRGGLQHKVLRKLRQGQYNTEAILDLHGMHVTEARENLSHFLSNCVQRQIKHVLIIHGKGHGIGNPILKNKVNQWLRQVESVLAFCSATHQDGRAGALYVLLKGRKEIE